MFGEEPSVRAVNPKDYRAYIVQRRYEISVSPVLIAAAWVTSRVPRLRNLIEGLDKLEAQFSLGLHSNSVTIWNKQFYSNLFSSSVTEFRNKLTQK